MYLIEEEINFELFEITEQLPIAEIFVISRF